MRDELIREVEIVARRPVIALMSDNHLDPGAGLEAVLLEASPHGGRRRRRARLPGRDRLHDR